METKVKRLNFGCGYDIFPDWTNVDRLDYSGNDIADILGEWNYIDYDYIFVNHVLHMFSYKELPVVLKRLYDTLKIGGTLRVIDFDPIKAFHAYERGDSKALVIPDSIEPTLDGKFNAYLTYYSTRLSILTAKGMAEKLERVGFNTNIIQTNNIKRATESYVVEGTK